MLKIRKTADGSVEGKLSGVHETTLLSRTELLISGIELTVWHFLTHRPGEPVQSLYLFNRMTCSLYLNLDKLAKGEGHWRKHEEPGKPVRIVDNEPHILGCPDVAAGRGIFHCDLQGRVMGGSNAGADGSLCLGGAYNPLDMTPVDLFCNNRANADLSWLGPKLKVFNPGNYSKNLPVHVEWPPTANTSCLKIPQGIREFFTR